MRLESTRSHLSSTFLRSHTQAIVCNSFRTILDSAVSPLYRCSAVLCCVEIVLYMCAVFTVLLLYRVLYFAHTSVCCIVGSAVSLLYHDTPLPLYRRGSASALLVVYLPSKQQTEQLLPAWAMGCGGLPVPQSNAQVRSIIGATVPLGSSEPVGGCQLLLR